MLLYATLTILIISALQVTADPLDDLRQEGLNNLTILSDAARVNIESGNDFLIQTKIQIETSHTAFYSDGRNAWNASVVAVDSLSEQLTLQAILDNRPASVLTCISSSHDNGLNSLGAVFTTFGDSIGSFAHEHEQDFESMRYTIELYISQLQHVYDANAANIVTCVEMLCFERNLAIAATEYGTLASNIESMKEVLTTYRQDFNSKVVPALYELQSSLTSEESKAVKALNKCM